MQFLNAAFLWAGLVILIPPIIHLFNFRRYKTVYFSDVRFLQNMKNITRKRSTLRQILLMILRMAALAMVVLAFAQPVAYKHDSRNTASRKSAPPIIYIDNSQSMQAGAMSGLNLETAKTKALEIVDAFPTGTDFLLITNDFEQKHNRLVKAGGIRLFLQEISTSPRVPTLGEVIERASMSLSLQDVEPGCDKNIFIISDFQKSICDFRGLSADSLLYINLAGIEQSQQANVAIDTIEFETPYRINGGQEQISVHIHNYGQQAANGIQLKLYINGAAKANETVDLAPMERKQVSIKYTNNSRQTVRGRVSITDYPIDYDNDIYFAYHIDSVRNILLMGTPEYTRYIHALLGKDPNFQLKEASPADGDISTQDIHAIVLCGLSEIPHNLAGKIQAYVAQGGNAIFIPAEGGNIQEYNYMLSLMECNTIISADTIKCKVSNINTQSSLLKGAIREMPDNPDLPYLTSYYNSMSNPYQGEEIVLETDSYKKVMTSNSYRAGKMFVFYAPLTDRCGNLATHRIIVPLLYNAASTSQSFGQQYYSVIGRDKGFSVKLPAGTDIQQITMREYGDDGAEFIPRVSGPDAYMNYRIFSENCVEKSGFMRLMSSGSEIDAIAYNYDRLESELDYMTASEVGDILDGMGLGGVRVMDSNSVSFATDAASSASTRPLWKYFVLLALIFLLAEMAVARFV